MQKSKINDDGRDGLSETDFKTVRQREVGTLLNPLKFGLLTY